MVSPWTTLAWGIALRSQKFAIVGSGVGVRMDLDGSHVGVVLAGQRSRVDEAAVIAAARAALEPWPYPIVRLEIVVDKDTDAAAQIARARTKRERRAKRPHGRAA